jgi:hypothetical protein
MKKFIMYQDLTHDLIPQLMPFGEIYALPPMDGEILSRIRNAMNELGDEQGVGPFLDRADLSKPLTTRFIAWLIGFGLTPATVHGIATAFLRYRDAYTELQSIYPTEIRPRLTPQLIRLVTGDVDRTITWFNRLAQEIGLPEQLIASAQTDITRMLILIGHSSPRYVYIQGYDRYAFLCYLLSLNFFATCEQPAEFAECLAFQLTQRFLALSDMIDRLNSFEDLQKHYDQVDSEIQKAYPAVFGALARTGHFSCHYALRWEMLMFADEHAVRDLFLLWDKFVAHRQQYPEYLRAMRLAHIGQIVRDGGEITVKAIQEFRNWNAVEIVNEVDRIVRARLWDSVEKIALGVSIVLAIGAVVLILRRRRERK